MSASVLTTNQIPVQQLVAALRKDPEAVLHAVKDLVAMLGAGVGETVAPANAVTSSVVASETRRSRSAYRRFRDSMLRDPMLVGPGIGSRAAIAVEVQSTDAAIPSSEILDGVTNVADLLSKTRLHR